MPNFAVILPAGGSSNRFGANKLTELLAGKPVLAHSLRAFTRRDDVTHLIVPSNTFADLSESLTTHASTLLVDPRLEFCPGGVHRAESVLKGLRRLPTSVEWVAIHDAARPLVSQSVIDETLAAAVQHGAAVAALSAHLTIKQATGPLPARVTRTLPRQELWTMQTPQIMRRADLLEAFERCPIPLDQITDDAQLLELAGKEVWLVAGDERNIKITTPLDLKIAELMLRG
ncbi:MAG: 2-C-methyl-D-erythritol 4-phosphate cytidylyltransferase [Anaerolineae bacterium]|nr:2-C-methyl-D-erythritol 4-phosphate cytidylyltransferase [Phycisphaerae bacterium]